jgi:hypothetical protein
MIKHARRNTNVYAYLCTCFLILLSVSAEAQSSTWYGDCDWSSYPIFKGIKTSPSPEIISTTPLGVCSPCFSELHPCYPPPGWTVVGPPITAVRIFCEAPHNVFDGNQCDAGADDVNGYKAPPCACPPPPPGGDISFECMTQEQPPAHCSNGSCQRECPFATPTPPPPVDSENANGNEEEHNDGGSVGVDPEKYDVPSRCIQQIYFAIEPKDVSVSLGRSALFIAQVNRGCPVSYIWSFQSRTSTLSKVIAQTATGQLFIKSVSQNDDGFYAVTAVPLNGQGRSAVSRTFKLKVETKPAPPVVPPVVVVPPNLKLPVILQQPQALQCEGNAKFSLDVRAHSLGDSLIYGWEFKKKGQTIFSPLAGEGSAQLAPRVCSPQWEGQYRVNVWNSFGNILSSSASVRMIPDEALRISMHPQSKELRRGASTTLRVETKGGKSPLRYSWQYRATSDQSFKTIATTTVPEFAINASALSVVGEYRAVIQDALSKTVTSRNAIISMQEIERALLGVPVIIDGPADRSGPSGSKTIMSVTAAGKLPLKYEWLKSGVPIATSTSGVLLRTLDQQTAGVYQVRISNSEGSVLSSPCALSIVPELPALVMQGDAPLSGIGAQAPKIISMSSNVGYEGIDRSTAILITSLSAAPLGIDARVSNGFSLVVSSSSSVSPLVDTQVRSLSLAPYDSITISASSKGTTSSGTLSLVVNGSSFSVPLTVYGVAPTQSPSPSPGGLK